MVVKGPLVVAARDLGQNTCGTERASPEVAAAICTGICVGQSVPNQRLWSPLDTCDSPEVVAAMRIGVGVGTRLTIRQDAPHQKLRPPQMGLGAPRRRWWLPYVLVCVWRSASQQTSGRCMHFTGMCRVPRTCRACVGTSVSTPCTTCSLTVDVPRPRVCPHSP